MSTVTRHPPERLRPGSTNVMTIDALITGCQTNVSDSATVPPRANGRWLESGSPPPDALDAPDSANPRLSLKSSRDRIAVVVRPPRHGNVIFAHAHVLQRKVPGSTNNLPMDQETAPHADAREVTTIPLASLREHSLRDQVHLGCAYNDQSAPGD